MRQKPVATPKPAEFYRDLATPGTLVRKAFTSPGGLHAVSEMNYRPGALCRLFLLVGSETHRRWQNFTRCSQTAESWMAGVLRRRNHRIDDDYPRLWHGPRFQIPTAFSAGFMKIHRMRSAESSVRPRSPLDIRALAAATLSPILRMDLAFAYVMNQMEQSLLPNENRCDWSTRFTTTIPPGRRDAPSRPTVRRLPLRRRFADAKRDGVRTGKFPATFRAAFRHQQPE